MQALDMRPAGFMAFWGLRLQAGAAAGQAVLHLGHGATAGIKTRGACTPTRTICKAGNRQRCNQLACCTAVPAQSSRHETNLHMCASAAYTPIRKLPAAHMGCRCRGAALPRSLPGSCMLAREAKGGSGHGPGLAPPVLPPPVLLHAGQAGHDALKGVLTPPKALAQACRAEGVLSLGPPACQLGHEHVPGCTCICSPLQAYRAPWDLSLLWCNKNEW